MLLEWGVSEEACLSRHHRPPVNEYTILLKGHIYMYNKIQPNYPHALDS